MISKPRALVLSPSATHPQDYGNRNRVWQVTNFMKESGYAVDFLFYPFEGEWNERIPNEIDDMRRAWDSFWIVPPTIPLHRNARGDYHELDEWWDESIGNFLIWLFARRSYEVFIVNYTFLSKAFTLAPKSVVRVLETHDRFSGRKEMLASLGVRPEFFYMTELDEKRAFERADIVIAIKESEAKLFEGITSKEVLALPFFPTKKVDPTVRKDSFHGLSVGFIGALNSVNSANMQNFLSAFDELTRYYCPPLRLLIGGEVCFRLNSTNPLVQLIGKVPSIEDFYAQVDVIVAPMSHSTGIKIKVGEALGFGKGIVSTENAFDGYPAIDPMHRLSSMKEITRALIKIAFDENRRAELIENSRISGRLAERTTAIAFNDLSRAMRMRARRILFVCDEPFWAQTGLRAARLDQWIEFCRFLMPVIIVYLRRSDALPAPTFTKGSFLIEEIDLSKDALPAAALVVDRIEQISKAIGDTEVMLSVGADWGPEIASELSARSHGVVADLWHAPLAAAAIKEGAARGSDLWAALGSRKLGIETTPLRYAPMTFGGWRDKPMGRRVLLVAVLSSLDLETLIIGLQNALRDRKLELVVLRARNANEAAEKLYEDAISQAPPFLLLSAGGAGRLVRVCRFLSSIGRTQYADVSSNVFPVLVSESPVLWRFLGSCYELVEYVLTQRIDENFELGSIDSSDGGWSKLWSLLEMRREVPNPKFDEQAAVPLQSMSLAQ